MYLGIEIGGTKLQVGVSDGSSTKFQHFARAPIEAQRGAEAILGQIIELVHPLQQQVDLQGIGIGFGGPVDSQTGVVTTSHQVEGWDQFPLATWLQEQFDIPVAIANDCDAAALAEATFGNHARTDCLLYVTVGTGIGGGLIIDGKPYGGHRPAVAEIGHLRPGLDATSSRVTVESFASGWGITAIAEELSRRVVHPQFTLTRPQRWYAVLDQHLTVSGDGDELDQWTKDAHRLLKFEHRENGLTAEDIAKEAQQSNRVAQLTLDISTRMLGWAIAQVANIVAPETIVVGGGVSQIGEDAYLAPLRKYVSQYAFPPLRKSFDLVAATLGEEVVVHGAIATIRDRS